MSLVDSGCRLWTWPAAILLATCLLASCPLGARSVRLALSLPPGMERTMRIEVRDRFEGAARPGARGARGRVSVLPSLTMSMTYRFRVLAVDDAGVAEIRCEVVEASSSGSAGHMDGLLKSLRAQSSLIFLDRAGRIRAAESGSPPGSGLPGFPLPPGSLSSPGPALGDLQALLGGVDGRVVSAGETWTSAAQPAQSAGLGGSLCWTVVSVAREGVRLAFRGTIEEQPIALARLGPGERARLSGRISGFVVLETATGWPLQGKTVAKIDVVRAGGETLPNPERPLFSLTAVTLFDPAQ